jgi:RNA polymerase sigma-70 factor (ECF subfamily)
VKPDADDAALVAAAQGGDTVALDALLRRHYDRVHAICRRLAGNAADADDATQEAVMAIVRGLSRFDGRASFSTWSYRVATNACLDELRRRGRRPVPVEPDPADRGDAGTPVDLSPAVADHVADRLEVDAALATLPPEFRAAVVLRDLCQLDYAEIAETLDIPPGTVRSRIARGRAALADHLATTGGNLEGPS